MKDVSIIIVNYNTKELLSNCIESIIRYTDNLDYEIIVVDNDSHDGSREMFSNDNRIVFVDAGENLGFGRANNLGAKYAKGKNLFLLNSDTILHNNSIKILYDFYEDSCQKISLGVIGSYLENSNGAYSPSACYFKHCYDPILSFFNKLLRLFHCPLQRKFNMSVINKVDAVIGADMFLSAKIFEIAGGFDPVFFMYGEEVELQKRITKMGYENYLIPGPRITHLEGGSNKKIGGLPFFTFYSLLCGKYIYAMKHFNKMERFILAFLNILFLYVWTYGSHRFTIEEKQKLRKLLRSPYNPILHNITKL